PRQRQRLTLACHGGLEAGVPSEAALRRQASCPGLSRRAAGARFPVPRPWPARPAYRRPNAYTLLLLVGAVKHSVPQYPEPQYTLPSTIAAPPVSEPPLAKLHKIFPVAASRAYMLVPVTASDPP